MNKGAIFVGYQGVGKSTLAGKNRYVDLESGNFWVDGRRDPEWYRPYCQIAERLAEQGYFVFTSSHGVVRDQIRKSNVRKFIISPALYLIDPWIAKLQRRHILTGLDKDYKAMLNAIVEYKKNVSELQADKDFEQIIIREIPYSLDFLITNAVAGKEG